MDRTLHEDGRKRQLPQWMLGAAAVDQVSKSVNRNRKDFTQEEEATVNHCCQPKGKGKTAWLEKEFLLPSRETDSVEESSFLAKCEKRRRKREVNQQDAKCNDSFQGNGIEKRKLREAGRKVQKSAPKKRKKTKSFESLSGDKFEASSTEEDDEDLTREDLMSIAKEFVRGDDHTGQQQSSDGEQKAESHVADDPLSRSEAGFCTIDHQYIRSPAHEEKSCYHSSLETIPSQVPMEKPSITDDPAQDMLDLFLGPLLKKPPGTGKIPEDISFANDKKKQNQDIVICNNSVPLTKKKSSLKDKVAMFLD